MGLPSLLAIIYFIVTIILILNKKKFGKIFILYGCLTFLYVTLYSYAPQFSIQFQPLVIFIVLSIMIMLAGLTLGLITLMISVNRSKSSIITAILGSVALILLIFNYKGYLTYLYIPVIVYGIQNKIIKIVEDNKAKYTS